MILKRFALFIVTLITLLVGLPTQTFVTVSADETSSDIIPLTSIELDLLTFNFDYTRYCLDEENYLHPVVITYKESNTSAYCDLMYVYVRLDPEYGRNGVPVLPL